MADYKFNFIKYSMNHPWWILVHDRHNLIYAKDTYRYCQLHIERNLKKKSVSMQLACGYLLQYKIVTNMHTNSTLLIPLYDMLKGDTLHFLINCRKCLSSDFIFRGHKWRSKRLLNTKQLLRWYSSCGTPISNMKVDIIHWIKLNSSPYLYFSKKIEPLQTF